MNGGYDDGYRAVPCFWGTSPGSLVEGFVREHDCRGFRVLDVGGGEGKNANALALAGADVTVVDVSAWAIENGMSAFPHAQINWVCGDVTRFVPNGLYNLVISYGLLHCLEDIESVRKLILTLKHSTSVGGFHILCAFNDRSQDLAKAHPGFAPLLLSHSTYVDLYGDWEINSATDTDLHEVHPHNNIPHHHSLTRLVARRPA